MNERAIFEALQKAVAPAVAASSIPSLPVKYLGIDWTVPNDQKWLEVVIVPNGAVQYWGQERHYQGLFRLILHWPKDNAGVYTPIDLIESIGGYFTKTLPMQNVRISESGTLGSMVDGGADMLYPFNMRYESFRT